MMYEITVKYHWIEQIDDLLFDAFFSLEFWREAGASPVADVLVAAAAARGDSSFSFSSSACTQTPSVSYAYIQVLLLLEETGVQCVCMCVCVCMYVCMCVCVCVLSVHLQVRDDELLVVKRAILLVDLLLQYRDLAH